MTVEMPINRLPDAPSGYGENDTVLVSGALMGATLYPDNRIDIEFFPKFIPMLDDLRHDFTWIYLEQMARLDGKYSARIYEWCKMQLKDKDQCDFIWYLNTDSKEAPGIRQWLNIGDKYSDWFNFRRRVLKPSLTKSTNVQVIFKYRSNLLEMVNVHQSMHWICILSQNIKLIE